jgi:hypothetical protein
MLSRIGIPMKSGFEPISVTNHLHRTEGRPVSHFEGVLVGDGLTATAGLALEPGLGVASTIGRMLAMFGVSISPKAFLTGRVLRFFVERPKIRRYPTHADFGEPRSSIGFDNENNLARSQIVRTTNCFIYRLFSETRTFIFRVFLGNIGVRPTDYRPAVAFCDPIS